MPLREGRLAALQRIGGRLMRRLRTVLRRLTYTAFGSGQCSECGAWLDGWDGGVCGACA
ncbi:hypothetical protein QF035_000055 [Streptomyces umbrinus]|uniref:ComF family protein n=1 Tax=Streptomyces umbrinus TaxID=67370 RepID=A0ABU0SFZ0_9ACTN|nr:hypothetical protein [Streptomyces umbrinus]